MPISPDPTSPVGNTIPLQKSDIERMRSAVDDRHIAEKAYNLDPGFRKAADHYRNQPMDRQTQKNLPSLLLNRYYFGKWQTEKTDPLTTALAKDATPRMSPDDGITAPRAGKGPFESFADNILDYGGAPARVAVGLGVKGLGALTGQDMSKVDEVKNLNQNIEKAGDTARVALPIAVGIGTSGASVPVQLGASFAAGSAAQLTEDATDFATGEQTKTPGQIAGSALKAGAMDAAIDAATMGAFRLAKHAFRVKPPEELAGEARKVVGKIIQGDAKSIKKATEALQLVDTTGVKTYDDLGQVLQSKVKALGMEQDRILDSVAGRRAIDSLSETITEGSKSVKSNPTQAAIKHLEELYAGTADPKNLVRVQALAEKAATEGLTAKEINAVAREYGSEFGQKAFSDRTGEALTSVNARMFENTRKGVKDAARKLLPNEASKVLDQEMSSMFDTIRNVKKMQASVQKLANKVETRGLLERGARLVGRYLDAATFHSLRGFTQSFFPSNVGMKTLNSLQIQESLAKNLSKFDDLTKAISKMSDEQAARAINRFVTEEITAPSLKAADGIGESRLTHLKGMNEGTPGIDFPDVPKNYTPEQVARLKAMEEGGSLADPQGLKDAADSAALRVATGDKNAMVSSGVASKPVPGKLDDHGFAVLPPKNSPAESAMALDGFNPQNKMETLNLAETAKGFGTTVDKLRNVVMDAGANVDDIERAVQKHFGKAYETMIADATVEAEKTGIMRRLDIIDQLRKSVFGERTISPSILK